MSDVHLDHPGDFHWFKGYGPAPVLGGCPHRDCQHTGLSVIAWGPDLDRYELMQCDQDCGSQCRAWVDGRGLATSPWLHVEVASPDFPCTPKSPAVTRG